MQPYLYFPKLRSPIDIRFEKIQDQEVLLLNCPIGIAKEPLLLVPAVAPILACFEGSLNLDQITDKFKDFGIQRELVLQLVTLLDQSLYLAGPQFSAAENQVKQEFINSRERHPALAGLSYALDAEHLRLELAGYLAHQKQIQTGSEHSMMGLMAPHIDYRRGGICYGITYNALKRETHDLYLLIGTSHQYSRLLFHLTNKDFVTPLGVLRCDSAFVEQLASSYGVERSYRDQILHRREHSLELQTPFIHYFNQTAQIVPILIGSFHRMLQSGKNPELYEEYDSLIAALTVGLQAKREAGARICVLAGVDMAHVGKQFGDHDRLSPSFMEKIAERDSQYLQTILKQNKHALFAHIAEDQDARRICGYPSMYALIDLFDRLSIRYKAELFDYRQAVDYTTDCAVTFAGVGFYIPCANDF